MVQNHDGDWRADSRARSQHPRIEIDGLTRSASFDEERAEVLCAQISRDLLGDFAPALTLLPRAERRRVQTLLAYARTLFDFARQPGLEGERLAQINRLEFDLELALGGHPPGQPAFVRMAGEELRRPWPREPLAKLAAAARRTALRERPGDAAEAEADARTLATAFLGSVLGAELDSELETLGGALLEVCRLRRRGETESGGAAPDLPGARAATVARLLAILGPWRERPGEAKISRPDPLLDLPLHYRRACLYARLAGRRLLHDVCEHTSDALAGAPRLGLPARLALLLRARWLGR